MDMILCTLKCNCLTLTLALMMVGRGSRIPCIFLKAGMTKRLHVTTADTGFPVKRKYRVIYLCRAETSN